MPGFWNQIGNYVSINIMAGIIGIYYLDDSEVDKGLLKEMTGTVSHR